MYNFAIAQDNWKPSIDCVDIYTQISEMDIYFKVLGYLPNDKISYRSPFTRDSTPSLRFKQKATHLMWKCFSTGKSGSAVGLVAELRGGLSFYEAVQYIRNNFGLSDVYQKPEPKPIVEKKLEVELFDKTPQSFYSYWESHYITKEILEQYDIKPARRVWLNNELVVSYRDTNPIIRYRINGKYKIYQPFSTYKWFSTTRATDIQGYKQLPPTGNILVISKAMKDVLVWRRLGFWAISLCSESANLPEGLVRELRSRFKHVVCILDNDAAGIKTMERYYNEEGIPYAIIDASFGWKDIADYIRDNGVSKTINLINSLHFKF